jgi:hypothetical protein
MSSILGFAGLAIDAGLWYFDKTIAQGAADAAAFTAGNTYNDDVIAGESTSTATTNAKSAAQAVAATYGYANGVNGVTVTINSPPTSGTHTSPGSGNAAFEVIIRKSEPLFFSALYLNSVSVASRNVTLVATTGGYSAGVPGCILQYSSSGTTTFTNGGTIDTPNCAYYGNGSSSTSLSVGDGSTLDTDGIYLVGSYNTGNRGQPGYITNTGETKTGQSSTADPYASVTVAAAETEAATEAAADGNAAGASCPNNTPTSYSGTNTTTTLKPGFYCGGLASYNTNNLTLEPGVYIIVGGYFTVSEGTTVNATGGVTIVLTGSSGGGYAMANIADGAHLNLNAPTTGTTAGLAIFGDPNAPLSNTSTFAGGSTMVINGAIDMRSQTVDYSNGTTNANSCTQLIAGSISFVGGAYLGSTCSSYGTSSIGGSAAKTTVAIVE